MKTPVSLRWGTFAACLAVASLFSLNHCANQGEGERCETKNGDVTKGQEDCADGLVCTPGSVLGNPAPNPDLCCPLDRTRSTSAACRGLTVSKPTVDASSTTDSGGSSSSSGGAQDSGASGDASSDGSDGG